MPLLTSEYTSFTLDNMGRFLCNTIQEAIDSMGVTVAGHDRGFDAIIIGGGTFGTVLAHRLFVQDTTRSRRILVLEAGPFVLPEHFQNLPWMGGTPDFRVPWNSIGNYNFAGLLYAVGGRSLMWGGWSPEPLHDSNHDEMKNWPASIISALTSNYFLAAGDQIGVTSTNDFIYGPLHEGLRRQLYDGLRLRSGAGGLLSGSLILSNLPDHPIVRNYRRLNGNEPTDDQLRQWLNLSPADATLHADLLNLLKLEAPLAVQTQTLPGLFPMNKFSAIPLIVQASRLAATEADGTGADADARKRFMVVPNAHVQDILTETQSDNWVRVTGVRVVDRTGMSHDIPLAQVPADSGQSVVVVALGTIESTRLARQTFKLSLAGRAAERMGENLMAHLRSNLNIRIPRAALSSLPATTLSSLQASALFVKGKVTAADPTSTLPVERFFHLQVTASGLSKLGNNSEAELFKKIPSVEHIDAMMRANDQTVVITLRGIGEMSPANPESHIGVPDNPPAGMDGGRPMAQVAFGDARAAVGGGALTQLDREVWNAMDAFSDEVALIFANQHDFEILGAAGGKTIPVPGSATAADLKALHPYPDRRDGLGTTHHEAGTLRMSAQAADGVTNEFGRIHDTTNCYVVGPALFPSTGSPNPMLSGVALAKRTGDLLNNSVLRRPVPIPLAAGFRSLFDGTGKSFNQWVRISPDQTCGFALLDGDIVTYGGRDFGLLCYAGEAFADFALKVEFRVFDPQNQNSGIFVRFRDPLLDPTSTILSRMQGESNDLQMFQNNRAWSAVHSGFEIQVDDNARGDSRKDFYGRRPEPEGLWKNRTGAVYKIPAGDFITHLNQNDVRTQNYQPAPNLVPGVWYEFEINVSGDAYTVDLTNLSTNVKVRTTTFQNTDTRRGVATMNGRPAGYIGLQSYPGSPVAFRSVQIRP